MRQFPAAVLPLSSAMLRTLVVSVGVLAIACKTTQFPGDARSDEPIPCRTTAQCPRISCGPCDAGAVPTARTVGRDCAVNPCSDAALVCNDEHLCEVSRVVTTPTQ